MTFLPWCWLWVLDLSSSASLLFVLAGQKQLSDRIAYVRSVTDDHLAAIKKGSLASWEQRLLQSRATRRKHPHRPHTDPLHDDDDDEDWDPEDDDPELFYHQQYLHQKDPNDQSSDEEADTLQQHPEQPPPPAPTTDHMEHTEITGDNNEISPMTDEDEHADVEEGEKTVDLMTYLMSSPSVSDAHLLLQPSVTCCICGTSTLIDPWLSGCGHLCCGECWVAWLQESGQMGGITQGEADAGEATGSCPECNSVMDLESLKRVILCALCSNVCVNGTVSHWTAPCLHTCCKQCWIDYLQENDSCPACGTPIEAQQMEEEQALDQQQLEQTPEDDD